VHFLDDQWLRDARGWPRRERWKERKRDRGREPLKRKTGSFVGVWEERNRERDLEKENVQRCWSSGRSLQKTVTACYSLNPCLLLPGHKCIQIALCQCMGVRVWVCVIRMGVCECERAHVRHTCHTFHILRESLRVSDIWVLPRACAIMSAHKKYAMFWVNHLLTVFGICITLRHLNIQTSGLLWRPRGDNQKVV